MDEEIWKPMFGHEPYYMVSNLGRVKSVDRMIKRAESKGGGFQKLKGRILKPYFNKDGYKSFANINRRQKIFKVRTHLRLFIILRFR